MFLRIIKKFLFDSCAPPIQKKNSRQFCDIFPNWDSVLFLLFSLSSPKNHQKFFFFLNKDRTAYHKVFVEQFIFPIKKRQQTNSSSPVVCINLCHFMEKCVGQVISSVLRRSSFSHNSTPSSSGTARCHFESRPYHATCGTDFERNANSTQAQI